MSILSAQHLLHMCIMLLWVLRENNDVIQVQHHINIHQVMEQLVHHLLECCWHVVQPKMHHQELKLLIVCVKQCLPFVVFLDVDVIVTPPHV